MKHALPCSERFENEIFKINESLSRIVVLCIPRPSFLYVATMQWRSEMDELVPGTGKGLGVMRRRYSCRTTTANQPSSNQARPGRGGVPRDQTSVPVTDPCVHQRDLLQLELELDNCLKSIREMLDELAEFVNAETASRALLDVSDWNLSRDEPKREQTVGNVVEEMCNRAESADDPSGQPASGEPDASAEELIDLVFYDSHFGEGIG